ncbi:MAG: hypothetical protein IKI45_08110 [Oscillospiraceae bacterium]|nr:hypothetical protein [Oscillospiraceae bacterium]
MNKKLITTILATFMAVSSCTFASLNASAYQYDNNGVYHSNANMQSLNYPDPFNHFKKKYGWSEGQETISLYKNGISAGTVHAYFNPESYGPSYARETTSSTSYGLYADGQIISNGSCVRSNTVRIGDTNWFGYIVSTTTPTLNVYGHNSCAYLGSIYW